MPEDSDRLNLFFENLPKNFIFPNEQVGKRLLAEYGAIFVARGGAVPPATVIFENEREVSKFQSSVSKSRKFIGGFEIELQAIALQALEKAITRAAEKDLSITPRGADAARRSYSQTVELWASRVNPALTHWVGKGRLSRQEAEHLKSLSPTEQVAEVLRLEEKGIYFSRDLSKSILYSVAAPGASQHLSLLALDAAEHDNANVRRILARHGWFQTVISDLPHFTYLGAAESELPSLGLKKLSGGDRSFWIPALD
ncbi:MAG TPA: hypothetical protein VK400_03225 [Pyrinomonadaceae bacterium]|nr:hypothetical protein [Pyrinomonadaceae bacterium]